MTPPADVRDWLVAEVQDLLQAGHVGLYEFIGTLRSRSHDRTFDEMRGISRAALDRLRAIDDIVLVQLVWPGIEVAGLPKWSELGDDAWNDLNVRPYYAIVRPEELEEIPTHWVRDNRTNRLGICCRPTGRAPMPSAALLSFVEQLSAAVPEVGELRTEHEEFYEELLAHVLFGDITRWAQETAETDPDSASLRRLLDCIDAEWRSAVPDVENLIAVSFVENIDSHTRPVSMLSPPLRAVADEMGIEP